MNILKLIVYLAGAIIGYLFGGILGALVGLAIAFLIIWIITATNVSLSQPMVPSGKQKEGKKEEPAKSGEQVGRLLMLGLFGFGLGVALLFFIGYLPSKLYEAGQGIKNNYIGGPVSHWTPGEEKKVIAPAGKKSDAVHFDGKGHGYNPHGNIEVYYYPQFPHQEKLIGTDNASSTTWTKLKAGYYRFKSTEKKDVIVYLN